MNGFDLCKERTEAVKKAAAGQWDQILPQLAPVIAEAMAHPGRHITCPIHGGSRDFRFCREKYAIEGLSFCTCGGRDGFQNLMDINHWDFMQAVEEVDNLLNGRGCNAIIRREVKTVSPEERKAKDDKIKASLKRMWQRTVPLSHASAEPVRRYFKKRKIGEVLLPLEDIGFHPSLGYYDENFKLVGKYPAMIAIARSVTGKVSTVHRTYLTPEGDKAFEGEATRKQYASPSTNPVLGCAIQLDKVVGPVLNLAEGIETALAVRAITRQPTWATLNKELLRQVVIPPQVRQVTIWADRDQSYGGQEAAIKLMDRLRADALSAVVFLPPYQIPEGKKSVDWNDVVAAEGLDALRKNFQVRRWYRGQQEYLNKLGVKAEREVCNA